VETDRWAYLVMPCFTRQGEAKGKGEIFSPSGFSRRLGSAAGLVQPPAEPTHAQVSWKPIVGHTLLCLLASPGSEAIAKEKFSPHQGSAAGLVQPLAEPRRSSFVETDRWACLAMLVSFTLPGEATTMKSQ